MLIRLRGKQDFGHVRIRVFIGKGQQYTLAKAGELMVDPEQWDAFKRGLRGTGDLEVSCVDEDEEA